MGTLLSNVSNVRAENNYNFIRIVAAAAVLISHAYPISLGKGAHEPLSLLIGLSLGYCAVAVFFTISGFLIAKSFAENDNVADWVAARALRIFPGLLVVLLVTVLILGPIVSTLSFVDYFINPQTLTYVPRNMSLLFLQYELPGVFVSNPYPIAINGSLWTLFFEVICYFGVFLVGVLGAFKVRARMIYFIALSMAVYCFLANEYLASLAPQEVLLLRKLGLPFLIGMIFYAFREKVFLSWYGSALLIGLTVLSHNSEIFAEVFVFWLCYTTFVLAYSSTYLTIYYNKLGDYSYGLYIYAFPIQQFVSFYWELTSPIMNIIISLPITIFCAVVSWHFVEKPILSKRHWISKKL